MDKLPARRRIPPSRNKATADIAKERDSQSGAERSGNLRCADRRPSGAQPMIVIRGAKEEMSVKWHLEFKKRDTR